MPSAHTFAHTKVDPNRLSTMSGNIDSTLNMVKNAFSAIDNALKNTLFPSWRDVSSTLFFQQYTADAEAFASYLVSMGAINDQLKEAAGIFESADDRAKDLVSKLKFD